MANAYQLTNTLTDNTDLQSEIEQRLRGLGYTNVPSASNGNGGASSPGAASSSSGTGTSSSSKYKKILLFKKYNNFSSNNKVVCIHKILPTKFYVVSF